MNLPKAARERERFFNLAARASFTRRSLRPTIRNGDRLRTPRPRARLPPMNAAASIEQLRTQIARATTDGALHAFDQLLTGLRPSWPLPQLLAAFSATARTLGRAPLGAESVELRGADDAVSLAGFSVDAAGRALLLLMVALDAPVQLEEAVLVAYDQGDTLEKLAIVRSLALLPDGQRFVELALDSGRTNDAFLFRALACDNPYPARHYPELEWNKLYMKAAFVGVPLDRIEGLPRRENPELARMALEYIEQQESAARSFAPELWQAIAAFPPPGAVGKLLGYASHAVPEMRLAAARALTRVRQPRNASFLRERLSVESDRRVSSELLRALDVMDALGERHDSHDTHDSRSRPS
jgi:hypothetical protein